MKIPTCINTCHELLKQVINVNKTVWVLPGAEMLDDFYQWWSGTWRRFHVEVIAMNTEAQKSGKSTQKRLA